ncbi:hypothetical protein AN1V17_39910 [Vallitalea sediminicola]
MFIINTVDSNDSIPVTLILKDNDTIELQRENERLKGALERIFPEEQHVLYEKPYRGYYDEVPSFQTYALPDAINKGKNIDFNVIYNDTEYMRPTYNSTWKDFYFRNWLYLPSKVANAHHKIFIYPAGASSIFDFIGDLAFNSSSVDFHKNINFLIYNFDVDNIRQYENQVILIGKPNRKGAQVISVVQDTLLADNVDTKDFLFQLATPKGYEIDLIYGNAIKYDYLKKIIEENTVKRTFLSSNKTMTLAQLQEENSLIKKELSNFIPIEDNLVITNQDCRKPLDTDIKKIIDLEVVKNTGKSLAFNIIYENPQYVRPIYDPIWKENHEKGWAYVPTKICENMHILFPIPSDMDKQADFFHNLTIKQPVKPINNTSRGILLFNFTPQEVYKKSNQIVIIGIPNRLGLTIITLDNKELKGHSSYLLQLSTPDFQEIDVDRLSIDKKQK